MIPILSGNMHSFFEQILTEHLSYVRHCTRCWEATVIRGEEIPVPVEDTVACREIVSKNQRFRNPKY